MSKRWTRIVAQPCALALAAFDPRVFTIRAYEPYILLFFPIAVTSIAIADIVRSQRRYGWLLVELTVQAASLIFFCALVYTAAGVIAAGTLVFSIRLSLYFSLVTWTTLGYGDVQPLPDYQLFAAGEALLGYIYLGLIISLAGRFMNEQNR